MPEFTGNIICDTREKNERAIERVASAWRRLNRPEPGGPAAGGIVRQGLGLGGADWGLEVTGADGRRQPWDGARVETKWMTAPSDGRKGGPNDLFGSMTAEYQRLRRECEKLAELPPPALAAFVCEGNASDFQEHVTPGGATFKGQVWPSICSLSAAFRLPFIFSNHAADWVAAWLQSARSVSLTDLELSNPNEPRPCQLITSPEELNKACGKASGPVQLFCSFPDDAVSSQAVRYCRLVQRIGLGAWFLDLPLADVNELMEIWDARERLSCGLAVAGGRLAPPPPPVGELAERAKLKSLHSFDPPNHGGRRKRTVRIAWGEQAGDAPLFVCFEPEQAGARIRVTDPERMIPAAVPVAEATLKQASEYAADVFKIKEGASEREAMPALLAKLREHWAARRHSGESADFDAADTTPPPPPPPTLVTEPAPALSELFSEIREVIGEGPAPAPGPEPDPWSGPVPDDKTSCAVPSGRLELAAHILDLLIQHIDTEGLKIDTEGPESGPAPQGHHDMARQPRAITWQQVTTTFDDQARGRLVMILGLAKVGKTACAASVYQHFPPESVYWISGGELDGWITARNLAGQPISGCDIDAQLQHPEELWTLLASLEKARAHRVVVLDSLDGTARWIEDFLCAGDGARRDRLSGLRKLDPRGYGLKLVATIDMVRRLHRLTVAGIHVVLTCGAKPIDQAGEDGARRAVLGPDLNGQAPLILPRFVSDIGLVTRGDGHGRRLVFDDPSGDAMVGSRSGFENMDALGFGSLLAALSGLDLPAAEPAAVELEMASVAAAAGIEPKAPPPAPAVPAVSMGQRYDDYEDEAAPEPQVAPPSANAEPAKRLILEAFSSHQVPLDYCDSVAMRYGAESWGSWSPSPETAEYAAVFVSIFAFVADRLGAESAETFAGSDDTPNGRPGIPLDALPFHAKGFKDGCQARLEEWARTKGGEPTTEKVYHWICEELQAISDELIPF